MERRKDGVFLWDVEKILYVIILDLLFKWLKVIKVLKKNIKICMNFKYKVRKKIFSFITEIETVAKKDEKNKMKNNCLNPCI